MEFSLGSEIFWLSSFIGAIIVALLYDHSPYFRYRFKFAVYILGYSTVSLCMIPFCLFRPRDVRNILIGVPFCRFISKLVGIKWEVSGKEILEKDFPCVIICNHQSMLDIAAIVELWPSMHKCAVISKKEVIYVFPFGIMAWLCGTVYINRRNPGQSQMKLSSSAEKICANKTKLWIFPEGTRSKESEIMPFKKGAFHIAMMYKLPIVPVVVSPYHFINDKEKTFDAGHAKIKIFDPIDTTGYQYPEDLPKLVETCHSLMNKEFMKMSDELRNTRESSKFSNGTCNKANDYSTVKSNGCSTNQFNADSLDKEKIEESRSS